MRNEKNLLETITTPVPVLVRIIDQFSADKSFSLRIISGKALEASRGILQIALSQDLAPGSEVRLEFSGGSLIHATVESCSLTEGHYTARVRCESAEDACPTSALMLSVLTGKFAKKMSRAA